MKTRYKQFNPKRRIASSGHASQVALDALAQRVRYGGNPEHKRNPGDFGLTPPTDPRPGKSLCDTAELFRRSEALHLLQTGVRKGLISDRHEGEWPKNVWSVTSSGIPLEAQLENAAKGVTPSPTTPPWQQGMTTARDLRKQLGNCSAPINNAQLLDLLGITQSQEAAWQPRRKHPVGIAKPAARGLIDFLPRKRHPIGKRFELARLVGEYMMRTGAESDWLVESDLATATQKRQRAFAAELLCPIDALVEFLDGDYSESAQEDAADHFEVSETTIAALLANNGCLPVAESAGLP